MNQRILIIRQAALAVVVAAALLLPVSPAAAATASAVSNIGTVDTRVADIAVECPAGTNLTDGSASINCGTAYVGSPAGSVTFTVRNTGTAALTLTNPVGKEGANASDFALGNIATSVAAGGSTTFTVTFTPTAAGTRTAALRIASNDADENPFDVSLSGTGISPLIAPVITWANPAAITYGTALSATQLKAKANVPGQLVYSPALGAKLPAGNQTLNVTFTPTDAAHYATAQKSVALTVNKAAATVTLAGLSQTYIGQPRVVTATTVPAGLNVSITYNGSTTVPVSPGSYAVLAAVLDDNATGSKSGTLVVAKGTQSITFPTPPALRFGGPDCTLTASASSGLAVSYASSAPAVATIVGGNKLHIVGAGKVTITASQSGDANWNPAAAVPKALTIGKQSQTIAFAAFPGHTVGESDFSPGATATSGLTITYTSASPAVASIVAGKVHLVGKGTVVITASQAGNPSWDVAVPVKQTLTVAGKPQTITFPALQDKGYGTADSAPGATASSALPITYVSSNPLVATIASGKIHITGVGTTTITAKQAGSTMWAAADDAMQTLNVIKGTPVITWGNPAAIRYGTSLTATQLNAKASVPGTFLYSPALGVKLPVGQQLLNATFTATDSTRYNTAQKSVTLTVNKATATVTLAGLSQTYNGQPRVVTVTTIPAGLNVNVTYNGSSDAPANCGTYAIVATVDDPNASGTKAGTLVIGKGNQTISFASLPAMHVGDADRPLTASAASGLPVSYASSTLTVVTIVDGKQHAVGTGTAFITATQNGDSNWNPAPAAKQLLTVGPMQTTLDIPSYAGVSGKRVYRRTENGVVSTWSTDVLGTTTANGRLVYFVQEYDENGHENDQSYLLADMSAGLFEIGGLNNYGDPDETTWYWSPDLPILMKTFVIGNDYPVKLTRTDDPGVTYTGKIKTVTERVTVPYGTFDTYKVTLTASVGGQTHNIIYWYAMNLGVIKRNEDGSLWEMTDYIP